MKVHERLACSPPCSPLRAVSTFHSFICSQRSRLRSRRSLCAAQCATLHAPLFQQRHISSKGLGLVAATDLAAGTAVLEEQVLLSVTAAPSEEWEALSAAIKALPEDDCAAYFQLANSFAAQHSDAYGVYRTNGFRTSRSGSARPRHGVFRQLSRVNHSCLANCTVSTHGGELAVLRAATDIPAGRELTLCYLNGLATSARTLRQEGLLRSFNFVCTCEACSAPPEQAAASDARRMRLKQLDWDVCAALDTDDFETALRGIEERLRLLDQENINDPRIRTTSCWDAFRICYLAPEGGDVTEWGWRLLNCSMLADGVGGPVAEALGRCVADPISHLAAADQLRAALAAGDVNAADEARGTLWGEDGGLLREQLPSAADIEMTSTLPQPA